MTFTAEFEDGPMEGELHVFMGVDMPYREIRAIPNRKTDDPDFPHIVVGYTGLPQSDEPWPEEICYVLVATELLAEPVGHYMLRGERLDLTKAEHDEMAPPDRKHSAYHNPPPQESHE